MARLNKAALAAAGLFLPAAAWAADVPGDAGTKATVPIRPEFTQGTFEKKGDHDWYKVTLEKGKDYAVSIRGPSKQDQARLTVLGPEGRFRASVETHSGVAANYEASVEIRAEATGTYYLDVSQIGDRLGSYAVRATGDCRHDRTTQCTAAVGQTQTRLLNGFSNTGIGQEQDWFKITLDANKTYTFTVDPEHDVIFGITDESQNYLKSAVSNQVANGPKITISGVKPPRTGTYFISVASYDAISNLYKLSVRTGS